MSRRRFSVQQLRYLRNRIPIASLIPTLILSADTADRKRPRFDCPVCGSHDTAVNTATNLARCFGCQQNFNPIEMVMAVKRMRFVDAVALLLDRYDHSRITSSSCGASSVNTPPPYHASNASNPCNPPSLGQVLPSVLHTIRASQLQINCCDGCKRLEIRLAAIERKLPLIKNLADKS